MGARTGEKFDPLAGWLSDDLEPGLLGFDPISDVFLGLNAPSSAVSFENRDSYGAVSFLESEKERAFGLLDFVEDPDRLEIEAIFDRLRFRHRSLDPLFDARDLRDPGFDQVSLVVDRDARDQSQKFDELRRLDEQRVEFDDRFFDRILSSEPELLEFKRVGNRINRSLVRFPGKLRNHFDSGDFRDRNENFFMRRVYANEVDQSGKAVDCKGFWPIGIGINPFPAVGLLEIEFFLDLNGRLPFVEKSREFFDVDQLLTAFPGTSGVEFVGVPFSPSSGWRASET